MVFSTDTIRNIALLGHGLTGKTSLTEQILFAGGAITKAETVESGKTVSDHLDDEISNRFSIKTTLSFCQWQNHKINLLDTPGSPDFVGEVVSALRAVEGVLMVIGAKAGVQIETIKLWRKLDTSNKPRMVFINKLDKESCSMTEILSQLKDRFKTGFVPVTVPYLSGNTLKGIIDLVEENYYPTPKPGETEKAEGIPADAAGMVKELKALLIEAAAEGDDEAMNAYFENGTLSRDEMILGITKGLAANKLVPVFCGSALAGNGISALLSFLVTFFPSPRLFSDKATLNGVEETVTVDEKSPVAAFCFKTTIDQFSGHLSYVKVLRGIIQHDSELLNLREQKKEKIGKVYSMMGKKLVDHGELHAGDIGVLAKLNLTRTNDSLCASEKPLTFSPIQMPQPVHAVTVSASSKKDEDKLSQILHRIAEEDLTFTISFNAETKESIVAGMGEQQINMILKKVEDSQKMAIHTSLPKVAYRETISKQAGAEYSHKKQTGGHGQYAKVVLEIRPLPRGEHFSFVNAIHGGSISKGYIPGVEKGVLEGMEHGILAGFPVVDIEAKVIDGKEHPVDSSEMAFKLAARGALKDAMQHAGAVLLEPIMNLQVFVEEQYMGDVLSDLSGRRGKVSGQEALGGGIVEIFAQVPQSELLRYSIDLRSITSGTGAFEMQFSHYSTISGKHADEIIKAAQATMTAESKD